MQIQMTVSLKEFHNYKDRCKEGSVVSVLGEDYIIGGYNANMFCNRAVQLELTLHPYVKPTPKSEEELLVEQDIKWYKSVVEHNQIMVDKFEVQRKELEQKRLEK